MNDSTSAASPGSGSATGAPGDGPGRDADPARPLNIGIACYPTYGGSGVIATEIGLAMAARGHRVHFLCYDTPRRYVPSDGVYFHGVEMRDYPLFRHGTYGIALASKMVEVATWERLDVLHVHYAVPHATSAYLARQVLGPRAPRVVTTLHGTDITLVGTDPSYLPITRFAILASDVVTAPSEFLRVETRARLDLPGLPIEVIPNFVDTERFAPPAARDPARVARIFAAHGGVDPGLPDDAPTLVHVSNFRPVKRVADVVATFARVNQGTPCRLLMVGDGPERSRAEAMVRELGLWGRALFVGRQDELVDLLQHADAFLLPSETESFGVAALEAMGAGVPVVASDVGGLPELVEAGVSGLLAPVGDVEGFARAALDIVTTPGRRKAMGEAARARALALFRREPMVDRYEATYRAVLAAPRRELAR